jgi:hypothetical protein
LLFAAGASDDGALEEAFLDRDLLGVVGVKVPSKRLASSSAWSRMSWIDRGMVVT